MDSSITFAIHEMVWLMDSLADRLLRQKYDIGFRKFHLLAVLAGCQPTTQTNLAKCMGYSPAAISKSIGSLVDEKLIKITVNPDHQRKNVVVLTAKGQALITECIAYLETEFITIVNQSGVDINQYISDTLAIKHILAK